MNKKLLLLMALLTGTAGLSAGSFHWRGLALGATAGAIATYLVTKFFAADNQHIQRQSVAQAAVQVQQVQAQYNPAADMAFTVELSSVKPSGEKKYVNRVLYKKVRDVSPECMQLVDNFLSGAIFEGPSGASAELKEILSSTGFNQCTIRFMSPFISPSESVFEMVVDADDGIQALQDFTVRLYRVLCDPRNLIHVYTNA